MRYFIKTFGCQMNHSDSERIAGFLESKKIKLAKNINEADLIIFNTCGVRQMAEDRVYGQVHNLRKARPEVKIILTGCLANRKDVQRRLKYKADLFFPISDFRKFENYIVENSKLIENCKLKIENYPISHFDYFNLQPKYQSSFTAHIPIMTGCNNFCSYCVVPYARGREISRPADEIIAEVKKLVKNGCKEIILLGQNVNSYNYQTQKSKVKSQNRNSKVKTIKFVDLLKMVDKVPGNFWITFISNHPKDFSDELIKTMTKCKKVLEYVHLPIQAGDDKVLRDMNRKYTAKEYLDLVEKIKAAFKRNKPGKLYAISSDIIVGFPGETRKQFLESAGVMEKVGYDMVYFGQYSPRPGTAAYKMGDNISKKEKERREEYLNEILKRTALSNNKKYVRKTLDLLITKDGKDGNYFGHTRTMKNAKIRSAKKNLVGKIVKVKIAKIHIWNLEGVLASS